MKFKRIHIELTNQCNFSCEFCPDHLITRPRGTMDLGTIRRLLKEIDAENLKRPTLLLVLSADCRYCEQNAAKWRELIASIGETETPPEVLALSLSDAEDTARYMGDNYLEVAVLLIDQAELVALGLRGVPGTIALDPGSETMRSWIGVLSKSGVSTILTWATAN